MKRARRDTSRPPAPASTGEPSKVSELSPIRVDYDEARSSEERSTYHQPRLDAQGEFFLDVHPIRRLKSLLGRGRDSR